MQISSLNQKALPCNIISLVCCSITGLGIEEGTLGYAVVPEWGMAGYPRICCGTGMGYGRVPWDMLWYWYGVWQGTLGYVVGP